MIDQFCIFICNVWWLLIAGSYNYMKRTGVGRIHHGLLLLVAVGMASMVFINLWGIGWSKGILLHCFIWLWVHKVQLYWMFEQNNNALLSFFVFCFKTSIILFVCLGWIYWHVVLPMMTESWRSPRKSHIL